MAEANKRSPDPDRIRKKKILKILNKHKCVRFKRLVELTVPEVSSYKVIVRLLRELVKEGKIGKKKISGTYVEYYPFQLYEKMMLFLETRKSMLKDLKNYVDDFKKKFNSLSEIKRVDCFTNLINLINQCEFLVATSYNFDDPHFAEIDKQFFKLKIELVNYVFVKNHSKRLFDLFLDEYIPNMMESRNRIGKYISI